MTSFALARMPDCHPNSKGWFEPILGMAAPSEWPWALPALYCVNVAKDPGEEVVSYSAKLDGSSQTVARFKNERCRVETVGYWRGDHRVVELQRFKNRSRAEAYAIDQFEALPVRYLMHSGKVIREKGEIELKGEWPDKWEFNSIRDLGVFCAYVYERAMLRGARDFAREFRSSIGAAWPLSSLVTNYRQSLMFARQNVPVWADSRDIDVLNRAIETTLAWQS